MKVHLTLDVSKHATLLCSCEHIPDVGPLMTDT